MSTHRASSTRSRSGSRSEASLSGCDFSRIFSTSGGPQGLWSVLLEPVALVILLVLVLDSAPGDAVGAFLLAVLVLGGVVGRAVDLLRVLGEVVPHAVRQIAQVFVRHLASFLGVGLTRSLGTPKGSGSSAQVARKWSQPERPSTTSPPRRKTAPPPSVTSPILVTGTSTLSASAWRTGSGAEIRSS